jgi:GMP reductase
MSANMLASGTFSIAKVLAEHKMVTTLHKFYSLEELEKELPAFNNPDYLCYTLGIRDTDYEKFTQVQAKGLDKYFSFICLDVPNGYLERFSENVKRLRTLCPEHIIIAGNVVTNEMVEELLLVGADIVKVGIGSGAACTTRKQTGVGYPQLSATIECADAAHGIANEQGYGLVIADGGLITPGDFGKSFCAGADFTMSGSLFSGYEQSGGDLIEEDGKQFKVYAGSSSTHVLNKHYGGVAKHRASEGRVTKIPFRGDLHVFLQELCGSLRSTGTYIGARMLKEFPKRATFILVNRQLNTSIAQHQIGN